MINRINIFRIIRQSFFGNEFLSKNLLAHSLNCKPCTIEKSRCSFQNYRFYSGRVGSKLVIPLEYFDDKNVKTINWDDVKNDLLINFSRNVKEDTVESQILQRLYSKRYWDLGLKFIDTLKLQDINLATQLSIINFMYFYNQYKPLDIKEKSFIIDVCNKIFKQHKLLSTSIFHSCIQGLSITSEWKKCFELMDKYKNIIMPTDHLYSTIISSAFKNGNVDLGWKYLQEMVDKGNIPHEFVCIDWINYCIEKFKNETEMLEAIEKYLFFCSANNLKFNLDTVTYISNIFSKYFGWSTSFVNIEKSGYCNNCKHSLPKVEVTNEDYIELKESLFKNAMLGKSVFAKSTPNEIENFLSFINENGPFDIVIDGLNVVYSKPKKIDTTILLNVIKHFKGQNKKILVIGRKHMEKWRVQDVKFIKQNSATFYTDDLSYDDTFLLYACLFYPGTKFVSRDLMRSHKVLLENQKLQTIFKKWQVSHQYILLYNDAQKDVVYFKNPAKCLSCISKNISWHIPYDTNVNGNLRKECFEFPTDWLCLTPQ